MRTWLRLHAQAIGSAASRLAGQPLATALSIAVIALALAAPILATVVFKSLSASTSRLDTEPHLSLYLAADAGDDAVRRIEAALRAHPESASVRFVSREAALAELKATTHLADLLATLDRNPLPHAFIVRVRSRDAPRLHRLRAEWQRLPGVDQVLADFEWSERLARWIGFGDRVLTAATVFLALAVVLVVGHLVRLQVLMRRDEIEVSQLIGATAADVRRPFLYHGIFQGLLSGVAALAIAGSLTAWLGLELQALTSGYQTDFKVVFVEPPVWLQIVLGTSLLGGLGAWLSVGRELRRFAATPRGT